MNSAELLVEAYGRIRETVHEAVDGLGAEELNARLDPGANSIAWLVWHLTRVQDDHIADAAGGEQVWTADGWADRFGLPFDPAETGYGHSAAEVGKVRIESAELLTGYHDAVHERTTAYLEGLRPQSLNRVVDESWSPPVTLGVRLASVLSDDLQHAGQAAFVRGCLSRR
ncbi:DinB family protein [Streptomyces sp. LP05-1]|uniref:DinB family protein n=1 Tax=Streptomyces pyxinae TaxID=2970734 RepID=A0ABT2CHY8_9ACTN|nr:DinB family protein [Streptomyces sp. LP05-1]MCS0637030.1 DinB family protein [Streptomyces sp. LP05-1]